MISYSRFRSRFPEVFYRETCERPAILLKRDSDRNYFLWIYQNFRSSHRRFSIKKGVLLKKRHWCFPMNFQEHLFYRTPLDDCFWNLLEQFFYNHLLATFCEGWSKTRRLLLWSMNLTDLFSGGFNPANECKLKVNNRNVRKRCEIVNVLS